MHSFFWVMRHADAGPTTDAKTDSVRPLSKIGVVQATAAGIGLKKLKTPIQTIMCSPLRRAEQTAEIVGEHLGLEPKVVQELAGPPFDVNGLIRGHGNVLLVGHSPNVNLIVYEFTGAQLSISRGGAMQVHEGEVWSSLNASTFMVMAGLADFDDPQDVDHRSAAIS